MELTTLLPILALLACPIGMGLMMWMMSRNMGGGQAMSGSPTASDRLHALQAQRQLLEQGIAEVEKIAALEAEKEALTRVRSASMEPSL